MGWLRATAALPLLFALGSCSYVYRVTASSINGANGFGAADPAVGFSQLFALPPDCFRNRSAPLGAKRLSYGNLFGS
jgi:hypothetical protein